MLFESKFNSLYRSHIHKIELLNFQFQHSQSFFSNELTNTKSTNENQKRNNTIMNYKIDEKIDESVILSFRHNKIRIINVFIFECYH